MRKDKEITKKKCDHVVGFKVRYNSAEDGYSNEWVEEVILS